MSVIKSSEDLKIEENVREIEGDNDVTVKAGKAVAAGFDGFIEGNEISYNGSFVGFAECGTEKLPHFCTSQRFWTHKSNKLNTILVFFRLGYTVL